MKTIHALNKNELSTKFKLKSFELYSPRAPTPHYGLGMNGAKKVILNSPKRAKPYLNMEIQGGFLVSGGVLKVFVAR